MDGRHGTDGTANHDATKTGRARAAAPTLTRRRFLRVTGLALGGLAVAGATPLGVQTARAAALHRYLGNYPQNRTTGWTENMQVVTHDSGNWFFSQTKALWKFPVSHDLNRAVVGPDPARGILKVGMPSALDRLGYNHLRRHRLARQPHLRPDRRGYVSGHRRLPAPPT